MLDALSGVRVLDLSRVLAGPSVTQMLADFGADVIKVERPGSGDESRYQGVMPVPTEGMNSQDSTGFTAVNRGKRSIAIDLANSEGQKLVKKLAQTSDIVVENFKTGNLKKYGLDYESLRNVNPGLIYCSITGFGQTGPYAADPGYDLIFQGMSGLMDATGEPDHKPGAGPKRVGFPISDATAGLYATVGILTALYHRKVNGGQGQHIDLALLDAQIAAMTLLPTNYLAAGQVPVRTGLGSELSCPYQAFDTLDGRLIVAVNTNSQFIGLCNELGLADLGKDERFASNASRVANREILIPLLQPLFKTRPTQELWRSLSDSGVPCGPLYNIRETFEDDQVKHRGMRQEVVHPLKGVTPIVANPLRFSATPVKYHKAPPMLGEHTEEILRDILKLVDSDISALAEQGVIGLAQDCSVRT
jgi:crotonobetainyl-CoA:carnitine CoA-transferase CaiB-like acyl-CoA transferase